VTELENNPFLNLPIRKINIDEANTAYRKQDNCIIENSTGRLVAADETGTVPSGVTSVGEDAFYNNQSLRIISLPDGVTEIKSHSFFYCESLELVTIPKSVTKIEEWAFGECTSLARIIFGGTVREWESIDKKYAWNSECGEFCVRCTDGKVSYPCF